MQTLRYLKTNWKKEDEEVKSLKYAWAYLDTKNKGPEEHHTYLGKTWGRT